MYTCIYVHICITASQKDVAALREHKQKQGEVSDGLRTAIDEARWEMAGMVPRAKQLASQVYQLFKYSYIYI